VRYPEQARAMLGRAGIEYAGWLPNYEAPTVFSRFDVTVHVPRRPYTRALPGIPTIRVFEAMACGIPLISAPWDDAEGLFTPGEDFLVARNGAEMRRHLRDVLRDTELSESLVQHAFRTIHQRHTCAHRVNELLAFLHELGPAPTTLAHTTAV
jgi:spore maturation protein CgeB